MPKIKLHSIEIQDLRIFDTLQDVVELVIHNDIAEIFETIPVLNRAALLRNEPVVKMVKDYLNTARENSFVFLDLLEGTNTTMEFLQRTGLDVYNDQIIIISSGDLDNNFNVINLDCFHELVAESFNMKISSMYFDEIFEKSNKPYKFLFLNNVPRPHRRYMKLQLEQKDLLKNALWSDLSNNQYVDSRYEDFFGNKTANSTIGKTTHNTSWPDGLLNKKLYTDTYFSVVTETNYDMPYQYFTEKIYKVLLMGHPFILVSGQNSYKFLHNAGYKTFGHLIDESFDVEQDMYARLNSIIDVINNLCNSDLESFLHAARSTCEHNRNIFLEKVAKSQLRNHKQLYSYFKNYAQN